MRSISEIFNLKNRVIIITGGAGLLAEVYAEILAEAGANIVLVDIKERELKDRVERIKEEYEVETVGLKTDITKEKEVKKLADKVKKKFGRIDVLINNAALNPVPGSRLSQKQFVPFESYPLELWQKELDINLTGMFLCAKIIGEKMVRQKRGNIINICSTYGVVAPDQRIYEKGKYKPVSYSATKSAVLNFTRYLAAYWRGKNIRVNTLTPGGVLAGQDKKFVKKYSYRTMLGRMANKDEYKGPILFLASDASSYMTGANLIVDGGWTAW